MMAASCRKKLSDSSSSDDEELRRCREAVWEARRGNETDGGSDVQHTKRVVVAQHEHDGNELQVTQGFRIHVAKKLGAFLDSYITEQQSDPSSCVKAGESDEDEGFRLFSTSVPGQTNDDPPAPVQRRPVPSSRFFFRILFLSYTSSYILRPFDFLRFSVGLSDSDSEMETRLKEAAVSIQDLLPASSLTPPAESPPSGKVKTTLEEEDHVKKKKKKKRKQNPEGSDAPPRTNGDHERLEQEVKIKRKKKKKQNTEEETSG
ncbi:protein CUSTOS isoform X1 [Antennarius striatus]|uniref:protein CUSTOS isoform X1 n=1 Tax=Antennarius striatus TaxID=241820 RepID=UPI0035B1609C